VATTRAKENLYLLNPWTRLRENYWEEGELKKKFVEFIGNNTIKLLTSPKDTVKI